jgi:WD40 repeat protein/subtilisin-like proprotein convertase family protein
LLAVRAPNTRQALARLIKLAKGIEVQKEPGSDTRELLQLAGIVSVDASGKLAFRNQIVARVFDEHWAKSEMPVNWRVYVAAAAGLGLAIWVPYWYTQVLPRPYIDTLSVVTHDYAVAEAAYERLARLPGFGARADRLLADVMVRRSQRAATITEVVAADAVIRDSLGMRELADEMLGEYWLRQSLAAMHRGDRDVALLYATEARRDAPAIAAQAATDLLDTDYARLQRTFRLPQPPISWDVDWERNELVVVDQIHRVERLSLGLGDAEAPDADQLTRVPRRLTAIQHVAVSRELNVEHEGTAGAFNLRVTVQHARASDLLLTLTAPSGAQATLAVPQPRIDQHELIFSARGSSELAALADEQTLGQWQLTLVDRRSGDAGSLSSWGLQFAVDEQPWLDAPEQGVALQDPTRSEQVGITLSATGRIAVAQPTRTSAAGALAVWDLSRGELIRDLPLQVVPTHVVVSARTRRVLAVSANEATIWDLERETPLGRLQSDGELVLLPAMISDEEFVAVAESNSDGALRIRLMDMRSGEVLANFAGAAVIEDWALGPQARYLAALDDAHRGLVLDPRTGTVRTQLRHHEDLIRLLPATDDTLVTVDAEGAVYGWDIPPPGAAGAGGGSWFIGTTADPASVDVAPAAGAVAFALGEGIVAVQDLRGLRQPQYVRADNGATAVARLAPQGNRLITARGSLLRLWDVGGDAPLASTDKDVSAVALDGSGEVAVFGYRGGHVRVRDISEVAPVSSRAEGVDYIGHRGRVTSLAVNAARNIIASGGSDGVVRIWNMMTVAPTAPLLRHPAGPVRALALSVDGNTAVSAGDYSARVWETQTGELLREIPVDGAALAVALSPATELVAVSDAAGNIFVGAPQGSEPMRVARAHAAVTAIAISADGALIVSGDAAGNVHLWDAAMPEASRTTYLFADAVSWVAFGTDAGTVFARSGAWVHELEVGPSGLAVVASRLLPIRIGPGAVPARIADESVRWLAGPTVGALVYADVTPAKPGSEPLPSDAPLLSRDWSAILGLSLDRATGTVRIAR